MRRFADTMTWAEDRGFAIHAAVDERMGFIRRTYAHLLGELLVVAGIAALVLNTPSLLHGVAIPLAASWPVYLLSFFGVSLVSRKLLEGNRSMGTQYMGAALWVVFLGIFVAPFAYLAREFTGSYDVVGQAFVLTACVFGGLTAYVFFTRKDFSFLGGALSVLSLCVIGVGFLFVFFSPTMSTLWMPVVCVVLLSGWVLYDTSKVLHHRHVRQHVAASVDLLVDFVYLFLHILLLLLRASRD
jgi:FtsH-binding integral membrane protein